MTCRGYNHVGTLFAFPSAWANAPDPVNPYVMWIDIENGFWCVPHIGATLAKKQMLLSALEAGLFLAKVRTAPHSATFDSSSQLSGVPAMLATGTARSVLLDHRKIFDAGLLTTCPAALLAATRTTVTKGDFDYFPPGTGNLGAFDTVFDCGFCTKHAVDDATTFAQQMQAIDGQLEAYENGFHNGSDYYVGMEDARLYPIFSDTDEMYESGFPNLLLWEDVASFLGSDFPIPARVRYHHYGPINRGMWSLVAAIRLAADPDPADILDPSSPPALPPGASGTHPRRLSSFLFACYAHVLGVFRSQEVASRHCVRFPHHYAKVRAHVTLTIEYQASYPDPSDPSCFELTASVTVDDSDLDVDENTELWRHDKLEFAFEQDPTPPRESLSLPRPRVLNGALSFVADYAPSVANLEAAGVGNVVTDQSSGAQWIEFDTDDFIAAAQSAQIPMTWWNDTNDPTPDTHTVTFSYSLDYMTPYSGDGEGGGMSVEFDTDPASLPCAAASWMADNRPLMCSLVAKGTGAWGQHDIPQSGLYAPTLETDFMASVSARSDDGLGASVERAGKDLLEKVKNGIERYFQASASTDLSGVFGRGEALNVSILSDAAIVAQIEASTAARGSTDLWNEHLKFRLPISGCSFSGLQACTSGNPDYWTSPHTMPDGTPVGGWIILLQSKDTYDDGDGHDPTKLRWLTLPGWLESFNNNGFPDNPNLEASADVLTVASLDMRMHGTN